MSAEWHGGKGDKQRKGKNEQYRDNWDRIFSSGKDSGTKGTADKSSSNGTANNRSTRSNIPKN